MRSSDKDIFLNAAEIDDIDQREAYLDEACGGDLLMRQRVTSLLKSAESVGGFLETPAVVEQFDLDELGDGSDPADVLGFLDPSEQEDSLGRMGHFEVQSVLGQGGAGVVLKAIDTKLNRHVAIKVLSPLIAVNRNARTRFVGEAHAAAAISHPNVTAIYAIDEHNQLPYLVMELVEGQTLEEAIQTKGPLDLASTLRIGLEIAQGLTAAHGQGMIHRDIKPANVLLVGGSHQVKITDFGLARAIDDGSITRAGFMSGTPQFMSPEQAAGQKLDQRTDLFSLGCVLYAMCAGTSPFKADTTIATIRRLCDETPRPVTEITPSIPEGLGGLINKLLAKAPEQRYQSAKEVADVLIQQLRASKDPAAGNHQRGFARGKHGDQTTHQAGSSSTQRDQRAKPSRSRFVLVLCCLALVALVVISELSGVTGFLGLHPSGTSEATPPDETNDPDPAASQDAVFYERLTSEQFRWSEPINLGPPINTIYEESYPRLSADGLLLVFSSNRPYPAWDQRNGDIWIASRELIDEPFGEPVNLGLSINTEHDEGQPTLSGDGLILVFSRRRSDGTAFEMWTSTRESRDSPWGEAVNMGAGLMGDYEYNALANLSANGLVLDFTSYAIGGRPMVPMRSMRATVADPWPDAQAISLESAPLTRNFRTFNFAAGNQLAVMLSIPDEGRMLYIRENLESPWVRLEVTDEDLKPPKTGAGNAFERYISADGATLLYDATWNTGLGERDIWMIQRLAR